MGWFWAEPASPPAGLPAGHPAVSLNKEPPVWLLICDANLAEAHE